MCWTDVLGVSLLVSASTGWSMWLIGDGCSDSLVMVGQCVTLYIRSSRLFRSLPVDGIVVVVWTEVLGLSIDGEE